MNYYIIRCTRKCETTPVTKPCKVTLKNKEKLKDRFKTLPLNTLEILLQQYIWEKENKLDNHSEKIILLKEIIKRKRLLKFVSE